MKTQPLRFTISFVILFYRVYYGIPYEYSLSFMWHIADPYDFPFLEIHGTNITKLSLSSRFDVYVAICFRLHSLIYIIIVSENL